MLPKPITPSVLSRILVAPLARSLIFSAFCGRVPSLTAMCKNTVRLYRFRMRHSVVSATSSTAAAGTLQTATPAEENSAAAHEITSLEKHFTI